MLADLAVHDTDAFGAIAKQAKTALGMRSLTSAANDRERACGVLSCEQALREVAACSALAALEECRVRWLGKKGALTEQLKGLGRTAGQRAPRCRRAHQ